MEAAQVQDLVQRMNACSAEEMRAVAIELAHRGTDEAVAELIGFMKTARLHCDLETAYDCQLTVVDALGETANPRALSYLRKIRKVTARPTNYKTAAFIDFPYAPLPLRCYMSFDESRNSSWLYLPPEGFAPAGFFMQLVNLYNIFRDDRLNPHPFGNRFYSAAENTREAPIKNIDEATQKLEKPL